MSAVIHLFPLRIDLLYSSNEFEKLDRPVLAMDTAYTAPCSKARVDVPLSNSATRHLSILLIVNYTACFALGPLEFNRYK